MMTTTKNIRLRIFAPGNKVSKRITIKATPRTMFTSAGVDKQLERIIVQVEQGYPDHEFGLVQLGPAEFNIVWRSARLPQPELAAGGEVNRGTVATV